MDKNLLLAKLTNEKVGSDSYSLNGGRLNEAYCLNEVNGQWEVYYSERGSNPVFAADLKTTIRIYFF